MTRIGIDLGTTNTLCSYWPQGAPRPQLIPIPQPVAPGKFGSLQYLPSAVYVESENAVFAGRQVKLDSRTASDQRNYFLSMKKRMGTTYMRDVNGLTITPEWVAACLLQVVRKAAENHIGTAIDEAVITVPASFSTEQRAATLQAAKLAGLDRSLLKLVDEPTAALCHALNEHGDTLLTEGTHKQYIMMIDIGGGTFDVSIVQVIRDKNTKNLDITLLGCSRYNEMAGDDFDLYIAAFLLNRMEQQRGFDSSELRHREAADLAAVTLYRAEDAKQKLSKLAMETVQSPLRYNLELMEKIQVPFEITAAMPALGNKNYRAQLSVKDLGLALKRFLPDLRNKHKNREERLYSYTIAKPIEEAMESVRQSSFADFDYKDLQEVLLTGGSAHLPLLEMAISRIVGHQPRILTDTMNSVALGASVFGAWAAGEQVHLHERINDSVFIHTADGSFEEVLSKNNVIPLENYRCRTKNLQISGGLPAKQVELRLFLGQSAQDPFMAPMTNSHILNFPEPIPSGSPIDISCSVGPDRCFHFTFTARLDNGSELEAKANVDMGRPDHSLERLPQVNLI